MASVLFQVIDEVIGCRPSSACDFFVTSVLDRLILAHVCHDARRLLLMASLQLGQSIRNFGFCLCLSEQSPATSQIPLRGNNDKLRSSVTRCSSTEETIHTWLR